MSDKPTYVSKFYHDGLIADFEYYIRKNCPGYIAIVSGSQDPTYCVRFKLVNDKLKVLFDGFLYDFYVKDDRKDLTENVVDIDWINKLWVRFLNKKYSEYASDYRNFIISQAEDVLGK